MKIHRQTARQEYVCQKCSKPIRKGDQYLTYKHRYARRTIRCTACYPRPSELTTSEKLSALYGAQEAIADTTLALQRSDIQGMTAQAITAALENVRAELAAAQSTAEDVAGEYEQSADNIENYFPGSSQADEIREKASSCEEWGSALDSAASGIDELIEKVDFADILAKACSATAAFIHALEEHGDEIGIPLQNLRDDLASADASTAELSHIAGWVNTLVVLLQGRMGQPVVEVLAWFKPTKTIVSAPKPTIFLDGCAKQASEIKSQVGEIESVLDEAIRIADEAGDSLSL